MKEKETKEEAQTKLHRFTANLEIIGINPFVYVPGDILEDIFKQAGKDKGHIPITGKVNAKDYTQTLVKYQGSWRLYINTNMLEASPKRIGETIEISVTFDPADRSITPNPKLVQALKENKAAKAVFDNLSKSKQHEIVRYISHLKTEESIQRNIQRAINFLLGKERFIGRDKP